MQTETKPRPPVSEEAKAYWAGVSQRQTLNSLKAGEVGLAAPACSRCAGRGYIHCYSIRHEGKFVDGYIDAPDEAAFKLRHPEAIEIGVMRCTCAEERIKARLFRTSGIPPHREHCTFEWFDSLPEADKDGKESARWYAQKMGAGSYPQIIGANTYYGLCLSGDPGVGKSGLAAAAMRARLSASVPCLWIDAGEFIEEIYKAQQRQFDRDRNRDEDGPTNPFEFVAQVANVPFLVLDDLGDMSREKPITDYQRDHLYTVIRTRYEKQLPSIITTNLSGEQLYKQFGKRIADRIGESWQWIAYGTFDEQGNKTKDSTSLRFRP